jgi:hypothetical protein
VVKQAREHYTFSQDVRIQSLNAKTVNGEFHEVTAVSYDAKASAWRT